MYNKNGMNYNTPNLHNNRNTHIRGHPQHIVSTANSTLHQIRHQPYRQKNAPDRK